MTTKDQTFFEQQRNRMMTRAWEDEDFKQRLLAEPATVMREHGLEVLPGQTVKVVENTDEVLYLILPAGLKKPEAPAAPQDQWGKLWEQIVAQASADAGFKQRLLADPGAVLEEKLGQEVPPGVMVKVLANTDALTHMVLPSGPPRQVSELTEAELAAVAGGITFQGSQGPTVWGGQGQGPGVYWGKN